MNLDSIIKSEAFVKNVASLQAGGGVVELEISGEGGGHLWLDLGSLTVSAVARRPHVIVRAAVSDFKALIEGRMTAHDGLLTERLHLAGDAGRMFGLMQAFQKS